MFISQVFTAVRDFGHEVIWNLKIQLVSLHSSLPLLKTLVLGYPLEAYKKNTPFISRL